MAQIKTMVTAVQEALAHGGWTTIEDLVDSMEWAAGWDAATVKEILADLVINGQVIRHTFGIDGERVTMVAASEDADMEPTGLKFMVNAILAKAKALYPNYDTIEQEAVKAALRQKAIVVLGREWSARNFRLDRMYYLETNPTGLWNAVREEIVDNGNRTAGEIAKALGIRENIVRLKLQDMVRAEALDETWIESEGEYEFTVGSGESRRKPLATAAEEDR
jgi:hypothetical protein